MNCCENLDNFVKEDIERKYLEDEIMVVICFLLKLFFILRYRILMLICFSVLVEFVIEFVDFFVIIIISRCVVMFVLVVVFLLVVLLVVLLFVVVLFFLVFVNRDDLYLESFVFVVYDFLISFICGKKEYCFWFFN